MEMKTSIPSVTPILGIVSNHQMDWLELTVNALKVNDLLNEETKMYGLDFPVRNTIMFSYFFIFRVFLCFFFFFFQLNVIPLTFENGQQTILLRNEVRNVTFIPKFTIFRWMGCRGSKNSILFPYTNIKQVQNGINLSRKVSSWLTTTFFYLVFSEISIGWVDWEWNLFRQFVWCTALKRWFVLWSDRGTKMGQYVVSYMIL